MQARSGAVPDAHVWLGPPDAPRAGRLHLAAAPALDVGVVICPPLGYEAVCAHRALRQLAIDLAAAGVPTLRLAYHGTGDSDGDDAMPARVATWRDDVGLAVDALRATAGVSKVVLIGVRIGATLAMVVAAERDDVDGVVAVAPIASGRAFARELRAFRKLADVDLALPAGVTNPRRADDEEVAGYLFTAETLAALGTLDLGKLTIGPARVVLVPRDDIAGGEDRLATHLTDIGTAVSTLALPGYAALNQDPHKSVVPTAIWEAIVDDVVGRSAGKAAAPIGSAAPTTTATVHAPSGASVHEHAHVLGKTRAAAIITEPAVRTGGPVLLWLNAGAVGHIGPNRLHVTLGRRWAARGVTSVRLDLPGFGDADVAPGGREHQLYDRALGAQVADAVRGVRDVLGPRPIVLAGLCAGAFAAFWAAVADASGPRGARCIAGALLINPQTFHFQPGDSLDVSSRATFRQTRYYQRRLGQADAWRRLLRGDVPVRRVVDVFARRARDVAETRARGIALRLGRGAPEAVELQRALRTLGNAGVPTVFVFSGDDPGLDNLEGLLGKRLAFLGAPDAKAIGWQVIDGPDHTFTPLWAQALLTDALEREVLTRWGRPTLGR